MFYFEKRSQARDFARKKESYKLKDMGSDKPAGRRWAVKVL